MRVTNEAVVARSLDRLNTRLRSYERAQDALATGRRVQVASDDPTAARRSLALRRTMRAAEQHLRNADDASSRLAAADNQLQAAMSRLQKARELAVAATSPASDGQRQAWAGEIREIVNEMVGIANTQHLGQPLFGGFSAGDAVNWDAGSSSYTTGGSGDEITRRIGDRDVVRVNVTAAEWLGFDGAGDDALTMLETLATTIESGNTQAVSTMLADVDEAAARVGQHVSAIGSTAARVDATRLRVDHQLQTMRAELSTIEDIDIAHGIMELETQQLAYETTLQALAKALPPSLATFLR